MAEPTTSEPIQSIPGANFQPDSEGFAAALAADEAKKHRADVSTETETPPAEPAATETTAATDKPAEQKPEEIVDEVPQFKTKKAAENWKRLNESHKAAIAERERKITEAQERITKLEADMQKASSYADYEDIKKERDLLSEQLRVTAIERHPRFKAHFDNRISQTREMAKGIVGAEHAATLESILSMPDSQAKADALDELTSNIGLSRASKLGAVLVQLDQINSERQQELANSQANWDKLNQQQQQELATRQQAATAAFNKFRAEVTDKVKGLPIFQEVEGNPEHNAKAQSLLKNAEAIFTGQMGLEESARASIWASAAPALLESNMAANKRIESLLAEINTLKAAKPSIGGGGETETVTAGEDEDSTKPYNPDDYARGVAERARKAGLFRR